MPSDSSHLCSTGSTAGVVFTGDGERLDWDAVSEAVLVEYVLFMADVVFKALCVDVALLDEDVLDPGGVVLVEEDWEAVRDDWDAVVVPLPRLFLNGEETTLQNTITWIEHIIWIIYCHWKLNLIPLYRILVEMYYLYSFCTYC